MLGATFVPDFGRYKNMRHGRPVHIKPAITRFGLAALLWNVPILADTISSSALHQFVGYTLIDILTITGWRDKDGTGDDGAFKGCKSAES
jgi:hypothetical protein